MSAERIAFGPLVAFLVAIMAVAVGCSSDAAIAVSSTVSGSTPTSRVSDSVAPDTTEVVSATTTTTAAVALAPRATFAPNSNEQAIARDVEARWIAAASWVGLPDSPDRERYTTGVVLRTWREDAIESDNQNRRSREPDAPLRYVSVSNIVFETPTRALYDVCVVDDSVVYHSETGEILDDAVFTKLYAETADLVDGTWKLAGIDLPEGNKWEGVAACAVE